MKSLDKKGSTHFRIHRLRSLLILFAMFFSVSVFSQAPPWQWVAEATGSASGPDVEGWPVAADAAGNVYTAGIYYGDSLYFGGAALANHSSYGMYLVKYDASGNVLWVVQPVGGFGPDPRALATDPSGNVVVAGIFSDDSITFGGITLVNTATGADIFVVKYDPNGNVLWARNAGGTGRDWAEGVACDAAGNIFVTGPFESHSLQIGSITLTNTTQLGIREDIFLAKFDPLGNVLWAVKAGGGDNDWSISVCTDHFGNAFICGPYFSRSIFFGSDSLASPHGAGHDQNFVASYDSAGNFRWARQILLTATAYDSYLYDVAADAFGNVYTVGDCISDTAYVDTLQLIHLSPNRDMLIAKYDSAGNLLWARRAEGNRAIYPFAVSVDAGGNAWAGGYFDCDTLVFDSTTSLLLDPAHSADLFVAKYRPDGDILWAKGTGGLHLPGSSGYAQVGLATDSLGDLFAGGCFYDDTVVFDNDTAYLNNCGPNVFVAKLTDVGGCTAAFQLFPDPTYQHMYWIVDQSSSGAPLSYVWQWGDSTVDSIPYPQHTYAVGGFYPICLTITDTSGCSDTYCHTFNLQRLSAAAAANTIVQVNVVPSFPTGINGPKNENGILFYPNPARDEVHVVSTRGSLQKVEIYSMLGQAVFREVARGVSELSIGIASLSPGIYMLKVYSENGTWIGKMIKE